MKSFRHRTTPFEFAGQKGVIVHDKLVADGPVDPETGKPLINPETGRPFPGINDDVAKAMLQYVLKVRGNSEVSGINVARFGFLSQLARSTHIFVYDHPRLVKMCPTAFTDGHGVFLSANFARKCILEEELHKIGIGKFGILPTIIHELFHKAKHHTSRMKNIPHGIANRAQDRHINALYRKAFGVDLPLIPMLIEMFESGTAASSLKYEEMSEEIIGRQMFQEYEARRNEAKQKHSKKKKKSGSGSGGGNGGGGNGNAGGSGGGDGSDFNPDQDENSNDSDNGDFSDELQKELDEIDEEFFGDNHHMTIEEMADIFQEEGLENVAKALKYPTSSKDKEGLEELNKKAQQNFDKALQRTHIEMDTLPNKSAYPGAHIIDQIASTVKQLRKNKIRWQMDFTHSVLGDSSKLKIDENVMTEIAYIDFGEGMDEIFDPALMPQKNDDVVVVAFDTSKSTEQADFREQFASEMLGLIDSFQGEQNVKEVILVSADTALRGEPIVITRDNIELLRKDGIPLFGDGGTNIKACVEELKESPIIKNTGKRIVHWFYVTDCEDSVPSKETLGPLADEIIFTILAVRNCYSEKWDRELDWGKVVYIEDGAEASLDIKARRAELEEKNRLKVAA